MVTMRLHRLHLSSNPPPMTLAMSCPHSQRVSLEELLAESAVFVAIMVLRLLLLGEIENDY